MSGDIDRAIRATLAIERRRARLLEAMRLAVKDGDDSAVIRCARALVGDDGDSEGDSAPARVEPGASRP